MNVTFHALDMDIIGMSNTSYNIVLWNFQNKYSVKKIVCIYCIKACKNHLPDVP